MRRKIIAVIGDAKIEKDSLKYKLAFETGKVLVDNGFRVQSGGMAGVMEAVFAGAKSSKNYREGDTIAIVPSFNANEANQYADISIPTGLDLLRNAIVAGANAVVAIGGGAGTLSEMAFSWTLLKLIIAYKNVDGWSSKLADTKIDNKPRYEKIADDRVYGVETPEQMINVIKEKLNLYDKYHKGIAFIKGEI